MSVVQELWHRVTGTQPVPAVWIVVVSGLAALFIVVNPRTWHVARNAITIAHEGGHALVSVLSGRRLEGIRLHADTSGVTYSLGRQRPETVVRRRGRGVAADPVHRPCRVARDELVMEHGGRVPSTLVERCWTRGPDDRGPGVNQRARAARPRPCRAALRLVKNSARLLIFSHPRRSR